MKITYFVHGTTTDNETDLATGWAPGELSELGIEQSKKLGELVADKKFDIVFCSDLKRAIDSARLAFGDKYEIIPDKRLREADYGDFTGKPDDFKTDLVKYINMPFSNGESYKDVEKRIADFLNEVSKKYSGQHIAIVAHQAPQLALEVLVKGKTWEQAINEDWRRTKAWQAGWEYETMDENKLKNLVSEIVEKASLLKNKHTDEKKAPVNYACIFSQNDDEFNMLIESAKRIGNIMKETPSGPLFKIQPLATVSGQLKLLKIRQPDKTRPERGDADFTVSNFFEFEKKYLSQSGFKLIKKEDFIMIELMDADFNVRAYFSNPPLDKQLNIK